MSVERPDRPDRGPSGWHRLPVPARLAVAAVGVLVLFAAIGLGSTGSRSRGSSPHPALAHAEATLLVILLAWTVVMTLAAAVWALTAKGGPPIIRSRLGGLTRAQQLALLIAVVVIAFLINALLGRSKKSPSPSLQVTRPLRGHHPQRPGPGLVNPHVVTVGVLLALALTLVLILALRWWERTHRQSTPGRRPDDDPGESAAVAKAISDALADLYAEPDPRKAVIAAYARMERALRDQGVGRRAWETPTEYLARVLREAGGHAESVDRLTALFQHAKFSDHPVDEAMRTEAITALERVRAGLVVPA